MKTAPFRTFLPGHMSLLAPLHKDGIFSFRLEALRGLPGATKPCRWSGRYGMATGYRMYIEIAHGLNPNDPNDAALDSDGDGLDQFLKNIFFTRPPESRYRWRWHA